MVQARRCDSCFAPPIRLQPHSKSMGRVGQLLALLALAALLGGAAAQDAGRRREEPLAATGMPPSPPTPSADPFEGRLINVCTSGRPLRISH